MIWFVTRKKHEQELATLQSRINRLHDALNLKEKALEELNDKCIYLKDYSTVQHQVLQALAIDYEMGSTIHDLWEHYKITPNYPQRI